METDDSQDSRGRERKVFIPLYLLNPLTKIQIFVCSFASKTITSYFQLQPRLLLSEILSNTEN